MESQFKLIGVKDRTAALQIIHDYADTTYFPQVVDEVINSLLHQQMLHTIHDIADKLIHGGYVISQIKYIANELKDSHEHPLTSTI